MNDIEKLVHLLKERGIHSSEVLQAMRNIPRHLFVSNDQESRAYEDTALPIGRKQVITQPYLVARMTEALLSEGPLERVLEIGTGSGYQAAVLSQLVPTIYSIERIFDLYVKAKERLEKLNIKNVELIYGDGSKGLPEYSPYDGILVTAAPDTIPTTLINQLKPNGIMIIPIGTHWQELYKIKKTGETYSTEMLDPVLFVPLIKGNTE